MVLNISDERQKCHWYVQQLCVLQQTLRQRLQSLFVACQGDPRCDQQRIPWRNLCGAEAFSELWGLWVLTLLPKPCQSLPRAQTGSDLKHLWFHYGLLFLHRPAMVKRLAMVSLCFLAMVSAMVSALGDSALQPLSTEYSDIFDE